MPANQNLVRKLDLRYKGERKYLHGTDLFSALVKETGSNGPVSLRLYRPMQHPLCFRVLLDNVPPQEYVAAFVWHEDENQHTGIVSEIPDEKVEGRYDYDEGDVIQMAQFDGLEVSLGSETKYSFVEKVVALQKALLNAIRGEKIDWWFSRLDLQTVPRSDASLRLTLTTKPGGRLVRSRIDADGQEVGSIFFSEKMK